MIVRPFIALALLSAALSACATPPGGNSDDQLARILVAPDKYVLFSCPEIAERARQTLVRQRELEGLIAKAGLDASGRLISAMAYRPEYIEKRGDMNELRNAAIAKNCKRVPGLDNPSAPTSAGAVQ